jgi:hypothetical protein
MFEYVLLNEVKEDNKYHYNDKYIGHS